MKWTEKEARWCFDPNPPWVGRRSANWEPAQALITALDQERARLAKARKALWTIAYSGGSIETADLALKALEASDE